MAWKSIRRVIRTSNKFFSNVQDTSWSPAIDSLTTIWQHYENEMNHIRESKDLPLRWSPPTGKSKPKPVAEDSLLKKLSDKCSANEILVKETYQPALKDEDTLNNVYDEIFEEVGRRYRNKIRSSKKAMKRRLDDEKIPTSSDGPKVQKHSMINPQRLFTPVPKKSNSFIRKKPENIDKKIYKNKSTLSINPAFESERNVFIKDTPTKDSGTSDKKSNVNLKPSQSAKSQNNPTRPVNNPIEPTPQMATPLEPTPQMTTPLATSHQMTTPLATSHQMTTPLATTPQMTSSLAPAYPLTSPLVPIQPMTGPSGRQIYSQQWNFSRMHRVGDNKQSNTEYSRNQKPKITFIQPQKSEALYRFIGCNIPATSITGPITSIH